MSKLHLPVTLKRNTQEILFFQSLIDKINTLEENKNDFDVIYLNSRDWRISVVGSDIHFDKLISGVYVNKYIITG